MRHYVGQSSFIYKTFVNFGGGGGGTISSSEQPVDLYYFSFSFNRVFSFRLLSTNKQNLTSRYLSVCHELGNFHRYRSLLMLNVLFPVDFHHYQGFSQDFETVSHFCGTFFFLIKNKQECNELSFKISYFALFIG